MITQSVNFERKRMFKKARFSLVLLFLLYNIASFYRHRISVLFHFILFFLNKDVCVGKLEGVISMPSDGSFQ